LHGLESVGIDSNPVAAAVARAKLVTVTPEAVTEDCENGLEDGNGAAVPRGEFWSLCYHPTTLKEICALRQHFLNRTRLAQAQVALRAILLGILHGPVMKGLPTYLSNQMPRTYSTKPKSAVGFWTKRGMKPQYVGVVDAVRRRAEYLLEKLPPKQAGVVRLGDSRKRGAYAGLGEFDLVITSPPYLGMRTYWPDQWLRNWFLGGPPKVEYAREDQITTQGEETFTTDLALVWKETARVCRPGARMVIRFGALPSYENSPRELVKATLREAECGWKVLTTSPAGLASEGRRQVEQFGTNKSAAIEEIDVHCRLDT